MKIKKLLCATIAGAIALSAAGCGDGANQANTGENGEPVITYWMPYTGQIATGIDNCADLPPFQKMMEATGVKVEFTHPTQVAEQANILFASGEYPDIIQYNFNQYPGGPQKAMDDGIIIPLNDVIENNAPNLKKFFEENPQIAKMSKTDEEDYYMFPKISTDPEFNTFTGPVVRKDLLDKLGMEEPETIDEWTQMLRGFKTQLGVKAPLTFVIDNMFAFTQAFDCAYNGTIINDEGKVEYGVTTEGFRQAVDTLRQWYAEGLLDQDIATMDKNSVSQKMANGDAAATIGTLSGGMGTWLGAADDPNYDLVGVKYPVINKGERAPYGQASSEVETWAPSISTQCKNLEAAAKVLDYGYSEEGRLLYSFGIEGETYEMVDGKPQFNDYFLHNPDGKSVGDMRAMYLMPEGRGAYYVIGDSAMQFLIYDQQKDALTKWIDTDVTKHALKNVTLNSTEAEEISALGMDLYTYTNAMVLKFITGLEPMENYDSFVATLEQMGSERFEQVYQQAYERFLAR